LPVSGVLWPPPNDQDKWVLPAERAEKVIGSPAWPVLAHKLDQLDAAGHDVEAMLRAVPSFVDRARPPTPTG